MDGVIQDNKAVKEEKNVSLNIEDYNQKVV